MPNRIAGVAFVKVDGQNLDISGSATIGAGGVERESLSGPSGTVGYAENPIAPFIEVEFFVVPGLSLKKLQDATDATITFEAANGTVYVLRNAWCTTRIEHSPVDGTATIRFEGLSCEEF